MKKIPTAPNQIVPDIIYFYFEFSDIMSDDSHWFGFGMGGDYNAGIGSQNMNGYALIWKGLNGINSNDTFLLSNAGIFESTLQNGVIPIPQTIQNTHCVDISGF